jgi:DNA-binding MarR family transcriptional regulator
VLIDELERLGYLERKRSAEDKRSVMLNLTQKGKKVLVRDPVNVLVDAVAALDDEGPIRLRDTLRHVLDQSDVAEQKQYADVCKRCIFLREDRVSAESRNSAEFTCRRFRAAISGEEIELLCTSFEHHRQ